MWVKPLKRLAHPRGGFSYVLAYNSADSESREPVLQHAMYYRLYHRSWFAGRKTYARQYALRVTRRGVPAGLRDKTVGRSQRGDSWRSKRRGVAPAPCRAAT